MTFAAGRFLGSQLYGMNPYNPVSDAGSRPGAWIVGAGRIFSASISSEFDLAASPYISHYPLTKGRSLTPKHIYQDMFR